MTDTDGRIADETSPLVGPERRFNDGDVDVLLDSHGHDAGRQDADRGDLAETRSSWYLFLLTLSIGG